MNNSMNPKHETIIVIILKVTECFPKHTIPIKRGKRIDTAERRLKSYVNSKALKFYAANGTIVHFTQFGLIFSLPFQRTKVRVRLSSILNTP